jgi:hypothetical protein
MSGRQSPEKARESIWRTQIPEQRDAGARSKASLLLLVIAAQADAPISGM